MTSRTLSFAHWMNIVGWSCILLTFLAAPYLGKPAFLGIALSIPFFGLSLSGYNEAAKATSTPRVEIAPDGSATSRTLFNAHCMNIVGWICIFLTFVAIPYFGKHALLGFIVAMPFIAFALSGYNAAAKATAARAEMGPDGKPSV